MSWPPSDSNVQEGEISRAFSLFHPKVQRWIWKQNWTELRDAQEAAAQPILSGTEDVIIAAATAGGKTEAAFFPICSRLAAESGNSVRVLYVSPLKALINDQFQRLEELCAALEIPVHRWHGDVADSRKRKLLKNPTGILLITPESLEALFVIHGTKIARLFGDLGYIVIDELHAFIGTERGCQLQSLLHRVERNLGRKVPRIALSATLGEMALAADFLRPNHGQDVQLIVSEGGTQELRMQVRGYRLAPPNVQKSTGQRAEREATEDQGSQSVEEPDRDISAIGAHLFHTLRGSSNLIFTNRRIDVERYGDLLRRSCEAQVVPNEFWPHHGNLSKELRENVEAMLKDARAPVNVVCTTTLELGIDIGQVTSIAQIGPPPSVASMRQRLGRSGRRGEPSIMRLYMQEEEITPNIPPHQTLRLELVRAIAMVNLLIQRWYEPPDAGELHLSTLIQQVLSMIAARGGVTAKHAWGVLCRTGPFHGMGTSMFTTLLHSMGERQLIRQMKDGTLILDEVGERIVNHYSFFAAFQTPEEYRLISGGRVLGGLPIQDPVDVGSFLIFAGRRWRVVSIDEVQKVIELVRAKGGRLLPFGGSGVTVHDRVREEMRRIYLSTDVPPFLDRTARALLQEGREQFRRLELHQHDLVSQGKGTMFVCWAGDRVIRTVQLLLRWTGLAVEKEENMLLVPDTSPSDVKDAISTTLEHGLPDPCRLASIVRNKRVNKYDWVLDDELMNQEYASRDLDLPRAKRVLQAMVEDA